MGLGHSILDQTGYMAKMGFEHGRWPRKCFNAHKNWLLGWYSSKTKYVDTAALNQNGPMTIHLAAFVDFDVLDDDHQNVLINIDDTYFLQYNRAKGANVETGEYPNKVTIVKGFEDGHSELLAGLDLEDSTLEVSLSASNLVINVCDVYDSGDGDKSDGMVLTIGVNGATCEGKLSTQSTPSEFSSTSIILICAISIVSCLLSLLLIMCYYIKKLSKPMYSKATASALSPSSTPLEA